MIGCPRISCGQNLAKGGSRYSKMVEMLRCGAKVKGLFYMYRLFHKKRKMNPVDDEYWYQKGYVTEKPRKRGR